MIGVGGYYIGTTQLSNIPSLFDTTYSWQVTQPAGAYLIFQVTDATGQVGYVQNIGVGRSGDESCLAASRTASSTAAVTASSTAAVAAGKTDSAAGGSGAASTDAGGDGDVTITSSTDGGYAAAGTSSHFRTSLELMVS